MNDDRLAAAGRWLLVTVPNNWRILKQKSAWVFASRTVLRAREIQPRDRAVVYLSGRTTPADSGPIAIVEFVERVHPRVEAIWSDPFPYIAAVRIIFERLEALDFKPVVPELSFIKNKTNWGASMQGALKKIPRHDFELLEKRMRQ